MKKVYEAPLMEKVEFETEETLLISIVTPGKGTAPEVGVEVELFGNN